MKCQKCNHDENYHGIHGCFYHNNCDCNYTRYEVQLNAELAALRSELATVTAELQETSDKLHQMTHNCVGAEMELEQVTAERDELFNVAVLSFDAMFEIGVGLAPEELTPRVRALDHALANDLNDELWERINAAALKGGKG